MKSIDLFAGCGGLSKGLHDAGFSCVWANEFDKNAAATFRSNFKDAIVSEEDIRDVEPDEIRKKLEIEVGQLDLLAGGFPCQGFSTYGQRNADDERNYLYLDLLRFVQTFRPKRVLVENVVGLLSMAGGGVVQDIRDRLTRLGYQSDVVVLQSADFGVPQLRKRVFIGASLPGYPFSWPRPTHGTDPSVEQTYSDLKDFVSVEQAISDLPADVLKPSEAHEKVSYPKYRKLSDYAREMRSGSKQVNNHSAKQLMSVRKLRIILMDQGAYGATLSDIDTTKKVSDSVRQEIVEDCGLRRPLHLCRKQDREVEKELRDILKKPDLTYGDLVHLIGSGGFANKYRRLKAEQPSHTLVAHMARDCSDFIHPDRNRFISVREAARLQSFPDTFCFFGSQFAQLKQIGNAVPPKLSKAVGLAMLGNQCGSIKNIAAE